MLKVEKVEWLCFAHLNVRKYNRWKKSDRTLFWFAGFSSGEESIFDYVYLSIRAETISAKGPWQRVTALPARPDTPESYIDGCLFACLRAAMA